MTVEWRPCRGKLNGGHVEDVGQKAALKTVQEDLINDGEQDANIWTNEEKQWWRQKMEAISTAENGMLLCKWSIGSHEENEGSRTPFQTHEDTAEHEH